MEARAAAEQIAAREGGGFCRFRSLSPVSLVRDYIQRRLILGCVRCSINTSAIFLPT